MNTHQLDADGVIINTIVVDSLDVFPNLVDASIGGQRGDRVVDGKVIPRVPTTEEINAQINAAIAALESSASPRRLREALLGDGDSLAWVAENIETPIIELRKRLVK